MRRHQQHSSPVDGSAVDRRGEPGRVGRHRPRPAAAGPIDLFGTAYAPADGTDGGTVIIGDWQEATQFNPYYLSQVTEANVASAAWATARCTFTDDYKYAPDLAAEPIPTTDNGGVKVPGDNGDAMTVTWKLRDGLKWSDGEPLTCDDFKYAWEWVMDPDNVGVITSGFEDITDCRLRRPTRTWSRTSSKIFEGYITDGGRAAAAPLPREDPGHGPGQRRGLPARRGRQHAGQRRVQVRVGHAAAPSCASPGTTTTRAARRASRPTSTRSCSSGTATPTR